MCDRNNNTDYCSECDFDNSYDSYEIGTDSTFSGDDENTTITDSRDDTDAREMQKLQDKKENCGHYYRQMKGCNYLKDCTS